MHHEPALRVLLAEDNPVNQKVAVRMLSKLGFQADVASNGMEVLRALESRPYDVVLMDVMMPVMDGLEATRQILERYPQERRPRIIALTANAMRGDRERCLDAGMDDYLAKPLRVEPLKESLSACIPNHESSDAPASNGEHSSGSEPSEDGVGGDGANAAVEPAVPAVDPRTLRELRDMLGGNDPTFLATIIGEYLADADELLATIRSAVSGRRASALQHAAHTLKSSSAMFGASVMAATCSELERLGAENRLDTAPARLQLLERQYDAVRNYLDARMKQAGVS